MKKVILGLVLLFTILTLSYATDFDYVYKQVNLNYNIYDTYDFPGYIEKDDTVAIIIYDTVGVAVIIDYRVRTVVIKTTVWSKWIAPEGFDPMCLVSVDTFSGKLYRSDDI